ncbi:MAG: triose-phosphate isomerase [Puniceicoccales bacterium]|jgi:triosephosphate isomerase|nr:triose-phosphate isomerase [Puniceicoccales bacterium]
MYRKFLIAGNWKMNNGVTDSVTLVEAIKKRAAGVHAIDMLVCPPFIALDAAYKAAMGSLLKIGAQNMYHEAKGAFTGEISFSMLRDCNVSHVILGHSERRIIFGESNELINKKVHMALENNLLPILCIGEIEMERESGATFDAIERQLKKCLENISSERAKNLAIAYEPVWAIGTGKTATPEIAQEIHSFIRGKLVEMFSKSLANSVRILYGGSMKTANAEALLNQPDIDGGLIGGASLVADEFCSMIEIAERLSL